MTFLHPWTILLGVLAAGLPLAVHFLTKPRPVRLPLSTLRFLREAIHQRRARSVLRDVIILLLRIAAVLLIALAIARPQWGERPLVSDQLEGDTVRVVALDVSQSMAATDRGVAALERARTTAANFLRYQPGLKANLVFVAAESRGVFDAPSVNFEQLRKELAEAKTLPQRADVRKFTETVAAMLAPASPEDKRRRELVIISDFQRSTWAKVDFSTLPEGTQIQWESVAAAEVLPNFAILDVRLGAQELSGGPSLCEVDVYNGSPLARQLEVELQIGDLLWNLKSLCPVGEITTLAQELQWKQAGWQAGEARLLDIDDALAADNVRPFTVHVPSEPTYALITRQPASLRPSSSFFLESALSLQKTLQHQSPSQEQKKNVLRIDPDELDSSSLLTADLILLDHPGKLPEETIKMLAGLLRHGRAMLYVASEPVDATNLKSLLDAAGENVRLPVEFAPPVAGRLRRDLRLVSVKRDRPPFSVFGDHLPGVLNQLRFSGGLESRRIPGRLDDDLLAVYEDGTAALVSATSDFGAFAVINANLNDSNLPKTGAFVPLIEEIVRTLIFRRQRNETVFCGESLFVQLPADASPAAALRLIEFTKDEPQRVTETEEENPFGEVLDEPSGTVWQWNAPERPGVYAVTRGENVIYAKSVALAPEESELEPLDLETLAPRLAGGHATYYRNVSGHGRSRDDLWIWLTIGCLVCMITELGAMVAFRD